LRALLAARLDQLEWSERRVLERGAVEGEVFHRGAVQALAPEEAQVTPRLAGLVRKELIRPERAEILGDDGFRFRHLLIRDAAYDGLGKSARAQLHERFARWLEERGRDLVELDEIVGYHLEQAARYRIELGQADAAVTNAAAERLAAAAGRAFGRSDFTASASLMSRAVVLLPTHDARRPAMLVDLGEAARESGRYNEAESALTEGAGSGSDPRARSLAGIALFRLALDTDARIDFAAAEAEGRRAAETAERERDDVAAAAAWRLLWHVDAYRCRYATAGEAARRAAVHALRIGDPRWAFDRRLEMSAAARGSTPTSAVIGRGEEVLAELRGQDRIAAGIRWNLALARAMRGEFEQARELMLQAIAAGGGELDSYAIGGEGLGWQIAAQQGDWTTAEQELRRGYDGLVALGATAVAASMAGLLATSLCMLGRNDQVEHLALVAATRGAQEDVTAQAFSRTARARLLAAQGEGTAAVQLAREATAIVQNTDALADIGYVAEVLAEMLHAVGRSAEARAAAEDALRAYERKEHLVGGVRIRRLLAHLQAAPTVS
jgi:tetratricopeptide (TPR) repeat protein